jgi:putative redox protein
MAQAKVVWNRGLQFVGMTGSGHAVVVDTDRAKGGFEAGPSNTELVAVAQGGCTGMDVVSILTKMKERVDDFEIDVTTDAPDDYPKTITGVHIVYRIWGNDLSEENVKKAVQLSLDKYCIISHTLAGTAEITHEILINPLD